MSFANRLDQKRLRRADRGSQKLAASSKLKHFGIRVTAVMVRGQRYLRDHGMPFSSTVANVVLRGDSGLRHEDQTDTAGQPLKLAF